MRGRKGSPAAALFAGRGPSGADGRKDEGGCFLKIHRQAGHCAETRMRGLFGPLFSLTGEKGWERRFFLGLSQSVKGFFYSRLYNFLHM
ncbi:MAG: hypothetical protein C6P37_04000 [Caldibacillus debilis]|uniref:Uncharacterized protein n=1 Tax=Caldibacillus debilis TaxID=301148 RepID=A0A3E0K6H5_9BACI|nr:MAG: hypothetical protein C6P37_04000 [Caldibacillus debilis]